VAGYIFSDDIDQDTNQMVDRSQKAQKAFGSWTEERVDVLLQDIAESISSNAEELAAANVEQTGIGLAADKVIKLLDEGLTVAYASDAGTPGVSDPGAVLVRAVVQAGHEAIPIPGPSAFASLVSIAGGLDKTVIFEGFLSPKPGRRRARLQELLNTEDAFVLYESPFRILKLLQDLADLDKDRYLCIGREMTKFHEEYLRGSAGELLELLQSRDSQKGEFSVYVSGKKKDKLLE